MECPERAIRSLLCYRFFLVDLSPVFVLRSAGPDCAANLNTRDVRAMWRMNGRYAFCEEDPR